MSKADPERRCYGSVLHSRAAPLAALLCLSMLALLAPVYADTGVDPGFVIELDSEKYRVSVRDDRTGELGPSVPVVLGSPSNPTPSGTYPVHHVILRPSWQPGPGARAAGARPEPSGLGTPMGVAKIPFARNGAIALHGGGDSRLLGQPISGGCVRASDADLLRIIAWLDLRDGLGRPRTRDNGEVLRPFRRPARVVVH